APPAVIHQRNHRGFSPFGLPFPAVTKDATNEVVAIGEGVRFDDNFFADGPLDRITTTVDLGLQPFDDNPRPAQVGLHPLSPHWSVLSYDFLRFTPAASRGGCLLRRSGARGEYGRSERAVRSSIRG